MRGQKNGGEFSLQDIKKSYRLSWDDKYLELCEEQGIERFNEVTFDRPMPSVKRKR